MKKEESLEILLSDHPMVDKVRVQIINSMDEKRSLNVSILAKNNQLRSNYIIQEFLEKHLDEGMILNKISWVSTVEELYQNAESIIPMPAEALNNGTEAYVFDIWKEVLKSDNFTVNDTFFEVGGDSLKCVQVLFHLNLKYPQITLTDLFTFTSIKELAGYIEELSGGKSSTDVTIHSVKF